MKKIIYLTLILVALVSCKDPNIGPGDGKPLDNAGYIQFESPAVGQKNVYVHFYAKAYWEPTPSPIAYTSDTITWEIIKQTDRNTFIIQEKLSGLFFGTDASDNQVRQYTLVKNADNVQIVAQNHISSHLMGFKDTLTLTLKNSMETNYTNWRIENTTNSGKLSGYVSNYNVKGMSYDKLDFYSDLSPMSYDGIGLVYVYNGDFGLVRSYYINPWVGEVNGFDLVRDIKRQSTTNVDLTNTHWKLKNVIFKDGTIKNIRELSNDAANPNMESNFNINFNPNSDVNGEASCNNYRGEYSTDKSNITIKITGPITQIWCPFSNDYIETLNTAYSFKSDGDGLIINVDNQLYSGFEYDRVRDDSPVETALGNTKWKLRNLQKANGDIVPIEKILNNTPNDQNFNIFNLNFADNKNLSGFSGCNTFVGIYKTEGKGLHIEIHTSTEVACKFSADYQYLLNQSKAYTADKNRLIVYIDSDNFKSMEFDRMN